MIGEQWKAVCCRKETVRGTELDIVQFGSFDSATYTAVIRDVRAVAEGVYCFRHICLSDRKYQRGSLWTDRREI